LDRQRFLKIKEELFQTVKKPQPVKTQGLYLRTDSVKDQLRPKIRPCDLCLELVEDPIIIHRIYGGKITRTCGIDREKCPDKTRNKFTKYK
jgi:hypothetical protein